MFLVVLAIAALLGWGQSLHYRFERFVPSRFLTERHYELDAELRSSLQEVGETRPIEIEHWYSRPGAASYYQERTYVVTLSGTNASAFMEEFRQRVRQAVTAGGGKIRNNGLVGVLKSGDQRFTVLYSSGRVDGMLRVSLTRNRDDEAQLEIITYEARNRN
jgi:hypothetical protein